MECNFKQKVKNDLTEKIHEQKSEGSEGANKTILMSGARASAKALRWELVYDVRALVRSQSSRSRVSRRNTDWRHAQTRERRRKTVRCRGYGAHLLLCVLSRYVT